MPVHDPAAAVLRARARDLRRFGAALLDCEAGQLHRRAGSEVWVGPTAAACLDDLRSIRQQLAQAADDLARRAVRLDAQAARLDAIAAIA